jgi:signal transduction histidine kinase
VRWPTWYICIVFLFADLSANATSLVLSAQTNKVDLSAHLTFLRDPGGNLTLDDVAAATLRSSFIKKNSDFNFGFTTDAIWLRLDVQRSPLAPAEWWLELAPAYIGEVALYQINGETDGNGMPAASAGTRLPISSREFKARHSTFKIELSNDETQTIYLRLRSNAQLNIRGYLWQPASYAEESASENLLLGVYYGAFSLIVGLCALRWRINRNPLDFWWLLYLTAEGFVVFRMNGLASRYFFPESTWLSATAGTISLSVMVWAGARFGIHAFSLTRNRHKLAYHAAVWIGNLALFIGFARLLDLEPASTICIFILSFLLCVLNCVCSWRFLKSGEPSAKFYFSGIVFMSACVILVLARNFGVIYAYQFIDYIWQSNLMVHAGLVSFGMILMHHERSNERRQASDYKASAETNLKSSELQKRIVALVSHEFRNALSMLSVSMHAINKRNDLPTEVIERHKNIVLVHHQMRKVIDNFLIEERIQNADINISYHCTEISILIEEVISLARLHDRGHIISSEVVELPDFLWLDDGILRLILTNLLDNAVKYSAAGSKVRLIGRYDNGMLHMSVSDTGIGMTAESLSLLYNPHFKANRASDGMGIGLYIVKMMLHAHHGDLHATSEIGVGTTMEFWLRVKLDGDKLVDQIAAERMSYPCRNWEAGQMTNDTQK